MVLRRSNLPRVSSVACGRTTARERFAPSLAPSRTGWRSRISTPMSSRRFWRPSGRGWQEGRTAVWEEHLIVGAVRTAIEALYPKVLGAQGAGRPGPAHGGLLLPARGDARRGAAHAGRPLRSSRFPDHLRRRRHAGRRDGQVRPGRGRERDLPLGLDALPAERASQRHRQAARATSRRADSRGGPAFAAWRGRVGGVRGRFGRRPAGRTGRPKAAGGCAVATRGRAMLELKIAWRFLWRSKAQSILIILGIARRHRGADLRGVAHHQPAGVACWTAPWGRART